MPRERATNEEEAELLGGHETTARISEDGSEASGSSISTMSLVLEHINDGAPNSSSHAQLNEKYRDDDDYVPRRAREQRDVEEGHFEPLQPVDKKARRVLWIVATICLSGWGLALASFLYNGSYKHVSSRPHDPLASSTKGSGKKVTLDQVMSGQWYASTQSVSWIPGPNGEDGLLLERNVAGKDYLIVEDIRNKDKEGSKGHTTLI